MEKLSLKKWAERKGTAPWVLAMLEHAHERAAALGEDPPAELTEEEFDEAVLAAAQHQVVQHHTPPEKE